MAAIGMTDSDEMPSFRSLGEFETAGYTLPTFDADLFQGLLDAYAALPAPKPIRATREQIAFLRLALPAVEYKPWESVSLTSIPIQIVDDVEESTPWIREWAAPYVEPWLTSEWTSPWLKPPPLPGFGNLAAP